MIDAIKPGEAKSPTNVAPVNEPMVSPGQQFTQQPIEHGQQWSDSPGTPHSAGPMSAPPESAENTYHHSPPPEIPQQNHQPNYNSGYNRNQTYNQNQSYGSGGPATYGNNPGYSSNTSYSANTEQPAAEQWGDEGEWPMMVAEPRKSKRKTFLLLILLLLILGGGGAAYWKRNELKTMLGMNGSQSARQTPPGTEATQPTASTNSHNRATPAGTQSPSSQGAATPAAGQATQNPATQTSATSNPATQSPAGSSTPATNTTASTANV